MLNAWSCKHLGRSTVLLASVSTLVIRLTLVSCWHDLGPKPKKVFCGKKVNPTDTSYFNLIEIQLESNCK